MNPLFVDRFQSGEIQAEFKKIDWHSVLFAFSLVLMLVSALAMSWGIFLMMSGWHSLDLSQDVRGLALELGADPSGITECNLGGDCYDLSKTYLDGALRMFNGMKLALFMGMLLVWSVCFLAILYGHKGTERGRKK
jgi:hypothetical protein